MKSYFKFKIAMISFAISGILLVGFGVAFFAYTYSAGIDRMDSEIRSLSELPMRGDHPADYWNRFGESIELIQGEGSGQQIELIVLDAHNEVLFQTADAPRSFTRLPRPELPPGEPNRRIESFFERNDLDGDHLVSRMEFDGPPFMFDKTDPNGDGFIDAEEAKLLPQSPPQFRERRRGQRDPLAEDLPKGPPPPVVSRFSTLQLPAENWRVGIFCSPTTTIITGINMDRFNAEVDRLRLTFMLAVPLGLVALGALGWFLAGRAMKPVAVIANIAGGITARGLDQRIPKVANDAELEQLVTVFNGMLDRLEKSYNQAVRFSADAAHELQTPLTILQGELDNAIQTAADGSEEQQRYGMLLEELRNLKAVVQKLLLLAHADEGRLKLNRVDTDLGELIENAAEDMEIMAPRLAVETRIKTGIRIPADVALLNQAIRNMTSNAAKYASENGRAVFTVAMEGGTARFTLANSAPPIPDIDRPRLFDRFHRVEKSRTSTGSGLGLSLAREIARAHGGDLVLDDYADGMVSFTLSLPLD